MAIGRLERALTRAEAAADGMATQQEVASLRQRHERLRARTKEAIDALDRLTGTA